MSVESKFIQITSASIVTQTGQAVTHLFALDQEGDVWRFDLSQEKWIPLPRDRKESV